MKKLLALTAIISLSQLTFVSALSVTLSPVSAGNFSQWTLGAGADKVSALSTNDGNTSYLSETVNGQAETFKMTNANIPAWVTVSSVTFNAVAKQQLGTSTIALRVEKGTTSPDISDDVAQSPAASYGTLTRVMTTNPFTGGAWTTGEVNNWTNAFGFLFGDTGSGNRARVTQASVVVDYVNVAPVATVQSVTVNEDASTTITLAGTDTESQPLTFATSTNPAHGTLLNLNTQTGQVTYIPTNNFVGTDSFDFVVNDSLIDSATATVSITVSPVNDAPSFTVASSTITVNEDSGAYALPAWATGISTGPSDESSQLPAFVVSAGNPSLFVATPTVSATGTLYFTPQVNANGSSTLSIRLTDNGGTANGGVNTTASSTITIFVHAVNDAPTLTAIGNKSVNENALLSFSISGNDVDGDTLTYSASNLPSGATFNPATHIFSWTPSFVQAGSYPNVQLSVSDTSSASSSENITITVNNVDRAPVLASIGNKAVNENTNLSFTVSGTDPDGDTVDLSATGLPSGATFSTSTGAFSWTPDFSQAGNYSVTFTATAGSLTNSEVVAIDVGNVNRTPTLTAIGNITADELTPISFAANASDLDGNTITYTLSGTAATAGATIDSMTGAFSWTPTESNGPGTYTATVTATDDGTPAPLAGTSSFTITVNEVNLAPISNDLSVTTNEDTTATTTLTATDSDVPVQTLTYSIVTQPTNGTLTLIGDQAVYTPNQNWFGTDSYEYVANDGVTTSATSTVTVTVQSVNDLPVMTLLGSTPLLLTVGYKDYVDPMVSVMDVEDGDISASATSTPVLSTDNIGDYVITYSVTDSDSGTASVTRNVSILYRLGGAEGISGVVGCRDPRATNYNASAGYDGVTCVYPAPAQVGQVLGASTSTVETSPQTSSSTNSIIISVSSNPSPEKFLFTRNLRFGMKGEDVGELQKILIAQKYLAIEVPTLYFGPFTRAAVMKWQTAHSIPATGLLGVSSRAILNQ